ncbi:hypothetical protein Q8A67_006578 [Cirrhinus molitorella]|uniref:SH2 domain-containing protein n=1 Tax=Cirrhinus molitorella TaxID=172907 RepID=A0AA88TQY6_9TELE|nr:hypothetical protein Q8A67_006578 [Cirrhinus molitorella]
MKEIANALTLVEQIQLTLISEELPEWKKRQQMACIGGPRNTCLEPGPAPGQFTVVAECLQQIRQQLKKVQELVQKFTYNSDPFTLGKSQLDEQALSLFKNLISNSLVVERQPCMPTHPQRPLVIKTGVQFTVKIRLLVKLSDLNSQPKAKIYIDKCRNFLLLSTDTKVMSLDESSGCLAAEFRHLIAKEKRLSNRSKELSLTVYEELHLISNLLFFLNPPPVKWGQLSAVLSWQFSSVTKCALNSEQLRTLADKLLGHESQGDPEGLVHWDTFLKEREEALLRDRLPGTFLLRFSENSQCGGIIITWVENSQDGEPVKHSTKPYTRTDLIKMSLPNIIRDYTVSDGEKDPVNPLIYLYPDIPRDVAFGRYYTNASDGEMNEDRLSGLKIQDGTTVFHVICQTPPT